MYFKYLPKKDMYEECAERLQTFFREKCGVELDVISDKDKTNYEYEIYVGPVTKNDLFRNLLLGTNDGDRVLTANGKWTDADDAQYVASCEKLVKSLCEKKSDLKFFLFYPQTIYRPGSNYEIGAPYVANAMDKAFKHLKDKGYNMVDIMDLGEMTKDMKKYFIDGLHPNDPGHKLIAERVAEYFKSAILGQ